MSSVETNMRHHTVTVAFDDDLTSLDAIISSLNDAGYTVRERRQLD